MVQLNTTSKPALGKQAQLRNEKFVDLQCVVSHKSSKDGKVANMLLWGPAALSRPRNGQRRDVQKYREAILFCELLVYSYVHVHSHEALMRLVTNATPFHGHSGHLADSGHPPKKFLVPEAARSPPP